MRTRARTETVVGTCAALLGVMGVGAGLGGLGGWVALVGALTVPVGVLLVLVGWWPSRAEAEPGVVQWPGPQSATPPGRVGPDPSEPGSTGPEAREGDPERTE